MRPLRPTRPQVLVSRHARETHAALLEGAAAGQDVEWVVLDDLAAAARPAVHAAFVSRDITGLSTKHAPQAALAQCYAVLRAAPELAWVHAHSTGADRPIYPELRARGVAVTTSAGANAGVVASTALGGLLALARRLRPLLDAQREGRWAPLIGAGPLPPDLDGQTAVIVGWGLIAQALQPHLSLLGMKVVVVRRSATPAAAAAADIETVAHTELHRVLPRADWLMLCCPLTDETRGLIDAAALARLPRGAQIVNVARGEVIVEVAMEAALSSGQLGGAFLDVFEHEPLRAESPLWRHPNVIVTPHSAGQSAGHATRVATLFSNNLNCWLNGQPLRHAIP